MQNIIIKSGQIQIEVARTSNFLFCNLSFVQRDLLSSVKLLLEGVKKVEATQHGRGLD